MIRRITQAVVSGSTDMAQYSPSDVNGMRLSGSDPIYSQILDTRNFEALGFSAIWVGTHGSGSFTVTGPVPTGTVVTLDGETYTSTAGVSSGTLWNTGTTTAEAAYNLYARIFSASALFYAQVSGSVVTAYAKTVFGSGSNYAISSSDASVSASAAAMVGGKQPSGTIYLQVSNNYQPDAYNRTFTAYSGNWDNHTLLGSPANSTTRVTTVVAGYCNAWARIVYTPTAVSSSNYDGALVVWVHGRG